MRGISIAATLIANRRLRAAGDTRAGAIAADLAFRNTVKGPPPGWTGPVFKLSRDYPATVPATCPE
jgi:hypothetical protein